jgi:hypothetical protein
MKTKSLVTLSLIVLTSGLASGLAEETALKLAREGNRFVGEQYKDKVIMIRSEKSVASLTPQTWFVNYRNDLMSLKGLEVKFIAGTLADVDSATRSGRPYDLSKLKIDSDKALNIATNQLILQNLTLRNSKMSLERLGEASAPVWRVQLWAARIRNPVDSTSVGEIFLSAEDGTVLKNDLKISRVD